MVISVHLHTILGIETPEGIVRKLDIELSDNNTVGDLLKHLGIELSTDALILVVNGRQVEVDTELQPGDRVSLMPAISGG